MTPYLILLCLILISVLYWRVWKINREIRILNYLVELNDKLNNKHMDNLSTHIVSLQSQIKQLKVKKEK